MSKLRDSARGQDCMIRIPGVCNHDPETTVLCHQNGGGMGMKTADIEGAFGCSLCHDIVDGRVRQYSYTRMEIKIMFFEAAARTRDYWLKNGFITIK